MSRISRDPHTRGEVDSPPGAPSIEIKLTTILNFPGRENMGTKQYEHERRKPMRNGYRKDGRYDAGRRGPRPEPKTGPTEEDLRVPQKRKGSTWSGGPTKADLEAGSSKGFEDGYGIESRYNRPKIETGMDWITARKIFDSDPEYTKLNKDTYMIIHKDRGETVVMWRDGKRMVFMAMPTDQEGRIPYPLAAERMMDTADGTRRKQGDGLFKPRRNVKRDFGETAKVQLDLSSKDPKELVNVYKWWRFPNESDIKGLDSADSEMLEILPGGKGKRHIVIVGGTKEQRKDVAMNIDKSFTVPEKKTLAGTVIAIDLNMPPGVAGYYSQRHDVEGKSIGAPVIGIHPTKTKSPGVVVHEAIHNLRDHDRGRKGALKHTKTYKGRDKDLEESMTEAETKSRVKPYYPERAGYYGYVKDKKGKSSAELQTEDRIEINQINTKVHTPKDRNKKGKRAVSSTRKNYPKTHISRMKMAGDVESVDSYYEAERKDGVKTKIQTYQPEGGKAADKKEQTAMKRRSVKLHEYRDGKKVRIK